MSQSEAQLEKQLIQQLKELNYSYVIVPDEDTLLQNLKEQLEAFNNDNFSDREFQAILNHLKKGNRFDKAKTLHDRYNLKRDDESNSYIQFFDGADVSNNIFQVTNQVTVQGQYENRYDVTILINGLPLVQIELKRRGLELKEAFNQVNRYHRHSYSFSALFQYIQIFVISNGINTKYYANNPKQSFKQTFYWADRDNKNITDLSAFASDFLTTQHLGKMISHYIVLNETYRIPMILRPYQYYATEAIIDRVDSDSEQHNGYIWHTTGSGKTLTSFKASQIIMDNPHVDKVIFVVDRKDLDYQTIKEFNSFRDGSIDGTDNTKVLINQFLDTYVDKSGEAKNTKLIVTTIQKLNNAISKPAYLSKMESIKDKRIVFIFDECHRSQFGETHKTITSFFTNYLMFGFTGTPIFADNAQKNTLGKRTTKDLFGNCLHKYTIVDAIADENVLKFKIEYIGRYKQTGNTNIDIDVEDIDTKEVLESPGRFEKIVDYIIKYHDQKTHNRAYSSIFCVSSIDALIKYYEIFKQKQQAGQTDLRIATIFTFGANENDADATGGIADEFEYYDQAAESAMYTTSHTRDKLDEFISDYNSLYGQSFSTKNSKDFDNYFKNISKRLKEREKDSFQDKDRLDILLVVNMFLTGFDAKKINTLYVDKNLKYHGLIQAFSRTNRILGEEKSQGNILCFRNLKEATDKAVTLFANKDANEIIQLPPYEALAALFVKAIEQLTSIAPNPQSVDDLISEDDQLKFVQAFRDLLRQLNVIKTYSDFSWDQIEELTAISFDEQIFEDYKSKYLDIYDKVKNDHQKEKTSILNDVDFETELIHRDEINVAYILKLIAQLHENQNGTYEKQKQAIIDLIAGDIELRSKRELIEKFIHEHLPKVIDINNIEDDFAHYWENQKALALKHICDTEGLDKQQFQNLIETYIYTHQEPVREDVINCLEERPSVLRAKAIGVKILAKMKEFVEVFIEGVGA